MTARFGNRVLDRSTDPFILTQPVVAPDFQAGSTLLSQLASQVAALPQGTLGYAQITAQQTNITSRTDIVGLSTTVQVAAGRRIRISVYCASFGGAGTSEAEEAYIMEGATQLQQGNVGCNANSLPHLMMQVILTPSAGSHTYKVQAAHAAGSVAATWWAANNFPSYIHVEDIGT